MIEFYYIDRLLFTVHASLPTTPPMSRGLVPPYADGVDEYAEFGLAIDNLGYSARFAFSICLCASI